MSVNGFERWIDKHPREQFYRWLAMVAVVLLGGLAYYGLHRDIQNSTNPCVTSTETYECAHYACGIGQYLPIPPSQRCREVLGVPPSVDQQRKDQPAPGGV